MDNIQFRNNEIYFKKLKIKKEGELMNKKVGIVAIIIILLGIIMMCAKGLVFDLRYSESEQIQISIGKDFDIAEIKQIAKEVFSKQNVMINKIGEDKQDVAIRVKDYTDEQVIQLNDKINEKYELENKEEDVKKIHNTNVRGRDIIKHFIWSISISTIIILAYVMMRYRKQGPVKIAIELLVYLLLTEMVLLSIYAITRLPISRITVPIAIIVYIATIMIFVYCKAKKINNEEKEQEK